MRPVDIQQVGDSLAIKWDDGKESFVSLQALREHCPCAACRGEMDIMGNVYGGQARVRRPEGFRLVRIERVGTYALQPVWADGHASGIYSFDYLAGIASREYRE
ncbi:MAG TPA: DUF971 domain-containing protein [Verrucomicrobia bacterium]|nr:DUF971 domain-containing protein [Verrucomicrobiota bacterium]HOP99160.1 DUF971 domain-containing protein [Verrucomicrobiota bacterium]HPU56553.1 DUF971 domain-containing protein [Verrucomicrobiota bacterium]